MIKYDYTIERDELDEKRRYVPSLPKELNDLVCVEGPNSSGKSTLLHLIALGLHGLKNKAVKDSLQRKLLDLVGSSHQELVFSFEIQNKISNITISSEKPDKRKQDVHVYETVNGHRSVLTPELFDREYNLVYDIPDDPIERLDQLTLELKDQQNIVTHKISAFKTFLLEVIREVHNAKDPKKIKEFQSHLDFLKNEGIELARDIEEHNNEKSLLERFWAAKYFIEYQQQVERVAMKIEALGDKAKEIEKKEKKIQKKKKSLTRDGSTLIREIRELINGLAFSLKARNTKTKEDYIAVWRELDLNLALRFEDKRYQIYDGIKAFSESLRKELDSLKKDGRLDDAKFLGELIDFLEHYSGLHTTIPGVNKTIPEFMKVLEEKFKECKDIKKRHDIIVNLLGQLSSLKQKVDLFITSCLPDLIEVLSEERANDDDEADEVTAEIDRLERELKRHKMKSEYYRDMLIRADCKESDAQSIVALMEKDKHLALFVSYDEEDLSEKVNDLSMTLRELQEKLRKNQYQTVRADHELERLEKKEPHKYQDRQQELDHLLNAVQRLETRFVQQYEQNLRILKERKVEKKKLQTNDLKYFDAVARYMGNRLGTIRHVDKEYPVLTIDLIDREIMTKSGKRILLTELGTGQGQSAYLMAKLKSGDRRRMIALIDEVAMMDEESMRPIFKLLRDKYEDGSLLAAVVVQKGPKLKVSGFPENLI